MQTLLFRLPVSPVMLALVGLMLAALPPGIALAQTQDDRPTALDFQEALEMALERNLELQQSANDVALSNATLARERGAFYPNLNLSVGPSVQFGRTFDQTTAALSDQRTGALSLNVSSSIILFDGFANTSSEKGARLSREASESSFAQMRQTVLHQAAARYLQVFLNRELIRVEEENLEAQRQQLESIRAAHEAGNRPVADVLQQEATIAQTEQRLIAAERDYELSKQQIKQTLHLSPQDELMLEAPSEELFTAVGEDEPSYNADSLVRQALDDRDDVAAQRRRIEASEQEIRTARSGYYPSVSLSAGAGTNYSSRNDRFDFRNQLTDLNPSGSIGLSISLPIFDRRQTEANVTRARVSTENERLQLELLEQEVTYNVQQALLDFRTARANLRAADRQLAAAEESLNAAEARYQVGASTLLEVTQARSVYVEAATGRAEARYNMLLSELGVAFYTGDVEQMLAALR